MTKQSEALRLADALEGVSVVGILNAIRLETAAAELRRQHEEITQLRHGAAIANQTIVDLVTQRDALLAALKTIKENAGNPESVYQISRAAIAKAEE